MTAPDTHTTEGPTAGQVAHVGMAPAPVDTASTPRGKAPHPLGRTPSTTARRTRSSAIVPDATDPTKFPFKSRLGFQLTPSTIQSARANQHLLDPISAKHRKAQARLLRLHEVFLRLTLPEERNSRLLAAALATIYQPSTTQTYFHVLVAMLPRYRDKFHKEVTRALAQEVARTRSERVLPENERLVLHLRTLPEREQTAAILQIVSASRLGDLHQMRLRHVWRETPTTLLLHFALPIWKSDRSGSRLAEKTIRWPEDRAAAFAKMWQDKPPYNRMYTLLQGVCTPHDLRRWAITEAGKRCQPKDVLQLTAHAEAIQSTTHVRRYTTPSPSSEHTQLQARVCQAIWQALAEAGLPMTPKCE